LRPASFWRRVRLEADLVLCPEKIVAHIVERARILNQRPVGLPAGKPSARRDTLNSVVATLVVSVGVSGYGQRKARGFQLSESM